MTESLLLQAQSLRLKGDMNGSIDLLRIVLSQCNSDLRVVGERSARSMDTTTTRKIRQMASYQLALLLLQISGRSQFVNKGETNSSKSDEYEADGLLWKLGYRLRLSSLAFGYPSISGHIRFAHTN